MPYFAKRVREMFAGKVQNIIIPQYPRTALIRGSVYYGTLIDTTQEFSILFSPVSPFANLLNVNIYVTEKYDVKLCSDEGVKIFGTITVILPDFVESINDILAVKLTFYIGKNESRTVAKASQTDKELKTILEFSIDFS
ncbi:6012_t:CDS:2 [Ambispora gerdemannii]|uniref:6012_t:CDS:1 n=1 Tax=Ambispora gerdemannii TaxID=144530 RepID=A0A9N9GX97_9GLOM|nr:6012_t:CDS:2 [Ambispora gerdemannii]